MSVQSKVISLIFLVFAAYGVLDYGVQRLFVLPSFQALEREEAQRNMDRAAQAIQREAQHLAVSATDWATWDDTYQFVQDRNEVYREANLNLEALKSLKVDVLNLVDATGQIVWGKTYDLQAEAEIALPELPSDRWPADHPLVALAEIDSEATGLLLTARGPLLVAARPVVTTNREGPVRGAVILGRFLDSAEIARQTEVRLSFSILDGRPLEPEETTAVNALGESGGTLIRESAEVDRVYRVLPDLFGKPALLLRVEAPKAITARGQIAIRFALLSLLGAGLLILIVLVIGLRQMVLKPIQRLTQHAVAVGQSGDLTARLTLVRRDELGVLAREFDRMVERLAETRRALVEQSYQSGIAEMASGVLHNIGNAITPLKVRAANLSDALRAAPTAELQLALTELADPGTPADRRQDLDQFVDLASQELATIVDDATGQLASILRQVDHVQKILSDQERFSRAARVLEPVPAAELVHESAEVLGDEWRQDLRIEVGESLHAAGALLGSRVALQQILVNLLKNAAEAIHERSPPEGGLIRVDASPDLYEGREMVHLQVADNGVGIDPTQLTRIFERGFSTKTRASGLGLHWCAVTAMAMDGRLYAESAGIGQGACLHLLLPRAPDRPAPATIPGG
jgi:sensor domain CHASE-containing protein